MLKDFVFEPDRQTSAERKTQLKARREDLAQLQQRLKQARLPVIVLVEGWGAAGKGQRHPVADLGAGPAFFPCGEHAHAHRTGAAVAVFEALF